MRTYQTTEIPGGQGTMNASQSPSSIKETDVVIAESITTEHDTWEKDGGVAPFNSVAVSGGIVGLWDFFSATQVQELLAVTDTSSFYTVGPSGVVKTLGTNLSAPAVWHFAEGATGTTKAVFLTNNARTMQLSHYDGTTFAAVTSPAADWISGKRPAFSFSHNNRLYAGPGASLHQIYASVVNVMDDYTTTPGALTWQVFPGEGQKLMGGCSFQRQAFLFKYPRGLYTLDDSNLDSSTWGWRKITDAVGLVSPNALIQIANDVIFLSPDGLLHSLTRTLVGSGDPIDSVILPIQMHNYLRENVSWLYAEKTQMAFYEIKRKVYVALPAFGSQTNNLMLVLDGHSETTPNFTISTRDQPTALAVRRDDLTVGRPIIGSPDGVVYKIDQDVRTRADGSGYVGSYETKDLDLVPTGQYRANLQELEIVFARGGNWTLTIDVYLDGSYSETLTFLQSSQGGALDFMFLDTDSAILGYDSLLQSRQRLRGTCRRIKLRGSNGTPGGSFSVVSHLIHFITGSERP